jgi:hypothetical protein
MQNFITKFLEICCLILAIGCDKHPAKPGSSPNELVLKDIDFITQTILENHPGPKNTHDPHFMNTLNNAHREAIADVKKVTSEKEHIALLKKYIKHFNDEHLGISTKSQHPNTSKPMPQTRDFSSRKFIPDITWVTLPTFGPNNKEQIKQLQDIITQMPKLRNNRLIIVDVRGNGGGDSAWGEEIIKALFGKEYAENKINDLYHNVYCDWRVSEGNAEHMHAIMVEYNKQFGEQSKEVEWASKIYNQLADTIKKGAVFSKEYNNKPVQQDKKSYPQNMCHAKIMVLIDKGCFSACLNFLDQLKALAHPVLFVGQTTNADTPYMGGRSVELPSKLGQFQFPIKVYRNRRRGSNQPHHPDVIYPGNINDTEKIELWLKRNIANLIETKH